MCVPLSGSRALPSCRCRASSTDTLPCRLSLQYVRDCLEVLRVGGQLDGNRRIKRGDLSPWSYVYTEEFNDSPSEAEADQRAQLVLGIKPADSDPSERQLKQKGDPNRPQLVLPPPYPPRPPPPTVEQPCDPNRPRLFHIFWAGAFTDKPYMAIMSFLYTQNLALDTPQAEWGQRNDPPVCRPQFHVWINPGAASSVPDPSAKRKMYEGLATNPWSAPFLHPRFQDVVKFRLWNTTEQLDGVPELKDHWRKLLHLKSTAADEEGNGGLSDAEAEAERALSDEELLREVIADFADGGKPKPVAQAKGPQKVSLGAKEEDYDKLSTVLSDMVRFVLLHRFGGVYLDADTLLLRDWEELWNWRGAWAYRWSKHDKYNTALIKMHKGSALTSFIFKTALENNMDFHPMHVSRYLADAGLDPLLYRIPDYVFDAAWINMEGYQHDRPPFPHFNECVLLRRPRRRSCRRLPPLTLVSLARPPLRFKEFFVGERKATAEPQAAGYEAFFRGSFAYHWHNNWCGPSAARRACLPPFNSRRFADRFLPVSAHAGGSRSTTPATGPTSARASSGARSSCARPSPRPRRRLRPSRTARSTRPRSPLPSRRRAGRARSPSRPSTSTALTTTSATSAGARSSSGRWRPLSGASGQTSTASGSTGCVVGHSLPRWASLAGFPPRRSLASSVQPADIRVPPPSPLQD